MKAQHLLFALALAAPLALMARPDALPHPTAAPATSAAQATTSKLVYGLLSNSRFAYRPRALDDGLSREVLKRYLEALDGGKQYFTAQDIAGFERYQTTLDDAIKAGDAAPAQAIFALYKQRVGERAAYARGLLQQDIFDFGGNDRLVYDREKAPWAASPAELDTLWKQSVRNDWLRLKLAGKAPADIRTTLDKRYRNLASGVADLNAEDAFQTFLNAYTGSIDPHTDYFNPRAADRFRQSMSLSLEGIGAQLQKRDDIVTIMEVIAGGPAALSKQLKAGDRIVGVGQGANGPMEDVVGWRIDDVVEKIKGPKGTQVRLDILPAEAGIDAKPTRILLTRAKIKLEEQAAKSKVLGIPMGDGQPLRRIGVIELPAFYQDFEGRRRNSGDYASASRDVATMLQAFKAQHVDGVLIDLRNNGGGSLGEAVEMTGLFIDKGPVVQVRESGGRVSVEEDRDPGVLWDGPLAVLINRGSASASEIFAGAIQDYGRGLVIGEPTFGKGTVQNMIDLDRFPGSEGKQYGQVKLTIAQFFLPGGSSTQNKGVVPDIAFPVTVDGSEFGESTYENALPWTRIDAAPHVQYGRFEPLLPRLRQLHDARIAREPEFQWWKDDVAKFRSEREKTWVSLNEVERRKERDDAEALRKRRQAERVKLHLSLDPAEDVVVDDGLQSGERDVATDNARQKAAEERPDPLLREAAAILSDATGLLQDRALSAQVLPQSSQPGHWAD